MYVCLSIPKELLTLYNLDLHCPKGLKGFEKGNTTPQREIAPGKNISFFYFKLKLKMKGQLLPPPQLPSDASRGVVCDKVIHVCNCCIYQFKHMSRKLVYR